jgi:hypothetical protein
VSSNFIVIAGVLRKNSPKVPGVEHDHMIQYTRAGSTRSSAQHIRYPVCRAAVPHMFC